MSEYHGNFLPIDTPSSFRRHLFVIYLSKSPRARHIVMLCRRTSVGRRRFPPPWTVDEATESFGIRAGAGVDQLGDDPDDAGPEGDVADVSTVSHVRLGGSDNDIVATPT